MNQTWTKRDEKKLNELRKKLITKIGVQADLLDGLKHALETERLKCAHQVDAALPSAWADMHHTLGEYSNTIGQRHLAMTGKVYMAR